MVHSTKHYVQFPIDSVSTGVVQNIIIVSAVRRELVNTAPEVIEGASVKAIYFELWLHNTATLGEFIVTISKEPEGSIGPTFLEQGTLFTYPNKKNVLYTSQGLTSNDGVSGPVNIVRGWVKIPKSKQRFGLGDGISLSISNVSAQDLNRCGFALFKEYS